MSRKKQCFLRHYADKATVNGARAKSRAFFTIPLGPTQVNPGSSEGCGASPGSQASLSFTNPRTHMLKGQYAENF